MAMQKEQEKVGACCSVPCNCRARASDGFGGKRQPGSTVTEYIAGVVTLVPVLAWPGFVHGLFGKDVRWRGQCRHAFTTRGMYTEIEVSLFDSSQRTPISGHNL